MSAALLEVVDARDGVEATAAAAGAADERGECRGFFARRDDRLCVREGVARAAAVRFEAVRVRRAELVGVGFTFLAVLGVRSGGCGE